MDAQTWRNLGLLLHIIGIVTLSSGAVGGVIVNRMLWAAVQRAPEQAKALARVNVNFGWSARIGSGIMLLSGLVLLAASNWVYWGQFWLWIKLGLFVLLLVNGALVAEPAEKKLDSLLEQSAATSSPVRTGGGNVALAENTGVEAGLAAVRQRLNFFHISENIMFLLVLVLGVFKFN
jgi:hypothetical protein